MAFNPFHSMRKNSKAILAVLTIFIMIIFVLSSGIAGGDFFNDLLPRLFGGKTKNPTYVEMYGDKVHANEIDITSRYRSYANQFMVRARMVANTRALQRINQQLNATTKTISPGTADAIRKIVTDRIMIADPPRDANPFLIQQADRDYQKALTDYLNPQAGFSTLRLLYDSLKRDEKDEQAQKDLLPLTTVINVMEYEGTRRFGRIPAERYFISFDPNNTTRDAMLFILFLKKADQLGIHFPTEVINNLIQREMLHSLEPSDSGMIERDMRQTRGGFTSDSLIEAIGKEFRVRAVLNYMFGGSSVPPPAFLTPYEFYEFYKDNRTEMTLNLVDLPVESFVAKVTEEPKPEDLKKLYDQYKSQEYDPRRETPGFRESAKVKVEWIASNATNPYYVQNAKIIQGLSNLAAGYLSTNYGGAPAAAMAQIAAPRLWESLDMRQRYDLLISRLNSPDQTWDRGWSSDLHETSKLNPKSLAALVGQLAPSTNIMFPIAQGALVERVYDHVARTIETRDRVKIGAPFVLAPYSQAPFCILPALMPAAASIPQFPALEAYLGELARQHQEDMIERLYLSDMRNLRVQLDKIRTEKKDGKDKKGDEIRTESAKYISEFVKARGFQSGSSLELRDIWNITKDPGLKILVDKTPAPLNPTEFNPWKQAFFDELTNAASANQPGILYAPRWFPPQEVNLQRFGPNVSPELLQFIIPQLIDPTPTDPKQTSYLAWRSDYVRPTTYSNYDSAPQSVKEKVVAAWKYQKARELAKKEADRYAEELGKLAKKELQDAKNLPAFMNELREKSKGYKLIELTKVSPLQDHPSIGNPRVAREYVPYNMPTTNIYYPGTMSRDLLDMRKKPLGDTQVLNDQPKAHYYVAVMTEKKEVPFNQFSQDVFAKSATQLDNDPLYQIDTAREGQFFTLKLVDRLKQEAHYQETEEFKKLATKKDTDEE